MVEAARVLPTLGEVLIKRNEDIQYYESSFFWADGPLVNILRFELVSGSFDRLSSHDGIVISESMARKYFGLEDPIGERLTFDVGLTLDFTVAAVIKDPRRDSHFRPHFLASMASFESLGFIDFTDWVSNSFFTYVRLRDSSPSLAERVSSDVIELIEGNGASSEADRRLQPLSDIHLDVPIESDIAIVGSPTNVWSIGVAGVLVLLLACINFVNLSLAKQYRKNKQTGVMMAFGAGRRRVALQLILEALLVASAAAVVALPITLFALPSVAEVVGVDLAVRFSRTALVTAMFLMAFLCAGLSSLYPVFVQSRSRSVDLLVGGSGGGSRGTRFRNALVVVQFFVAFVIVSSTLIIEDQIDYSFDRNPGLPASQLLILNARTYGHAPAPIPFDVLTEQIGNITGIVGASAAGDVPGDSPRRASYLPEAVSPSEDGGNLTFELISADSTGVNVLDLKLTMGSEFSNGGASGDGNVVLINQTAVDQLVKRFGPTWNNPVDRELRRYQMIGGRSRYVGSVRIAGVVEDFQYSSLKAAVVPMIIDLNGRRFDHVIVRFDPRRTGDILADLEKVWKDVLPERPFDYYFLDTAFRSQFGAEQMIRTMLGVLGMLCVLIGCLGLFGLTAFTTARRKGEIAIRKAMGASVASIFGLLTYDILKLLAIAILLATPIAYLVMSKWLAGFAYAVSISPVVFLLMGGIAALLAIGSISFHVLTASVQAPVESLREAK